MAKSKKKLEPAQTPDKWIQGALNPKTEGVFSQKAANAGMSTAEFANKVTAPSSKASPKTRKQGQLAKTLASFRKGKKKAKKKAKKKGG